MGRKRTTWQPPDRAFRIRRGFAFAGANKLEATMLRRVPQHLVTRIHGRLLPAEPGHRAAVPIDPSYGAIPRDPITIELMAEDERSYFLERAEAELEQAQSATHPSAVRAHYYLANLYLDRVYGGDDAERAPEAA